MTTELDQITTALAQAMQGEPAPSFKSQEFLRLIGAVNALTNTDNIGEPLTRLVHEQIGLKALQLLLDRMSASMHSERAVAMMRDNGKKPC